MEGYTSEKEQIETIKNWWRDNGKSVISGVLIGLLVVMGVKYWTQHQGQQEELASSAYEQFLMDVEQGHKEAALERNGYLQKEHAGSGYAALAALTVAKLKVEEGDLGAARTQLQWVVNHSKDEGIKQTAALRLARVILDQGDAAAALKALGDQPLKTFEPMYEELKGDIYVAMNNPAEARKSYTKAIAGAKEGGLPWVQHKLDDLGGGGS